jgi:hypothetical protein
MRHQRLFGAGLLAAGFAAVALCLGTVVGPVIGAAAAGVPAHAAQGRGAQGSGGGAGGPWGALAGAYPLAGRDGGVPPRGRAAGWWSRPAGPRPAAAR